MAVFSSDIDPGPAPYIRTCSIDPHHDKTGLAYPYRILHRRFFCGS
jgi:hypothetical protein